MPGKLRLIPWLTATCLFAASGDSRLADATRRLDRAAVRALLQQHADVNAPQVDGTTALHWAAQNDDLEAADLLVRAGADVKRSEERRVGKECRSRWSPYH